MTQCEIVDITPDEQEQPLLHPQEIPRADGPKSILTPAQFKAEKEALQHDFPTLDPIHVDFLMYMRARGATFEAPRDGQPVVSMKAMATPGEQ